MNSYFGICIPNFLFNYQKLLMRRERGRKRDMRGEIRKEGETYLWSWRGREWEEGTKT